MSSKPFVFRSPSRPLQTPTVTIDTHDEVLRLCQAWRKTSGVKAAEYAAKVASVSEGERKDDSRTPYGHVQQSAFSKSITDGGKLLLGLDLEGRDLGNDGTVDILATYDADANVTYLFDVLALQEKAFEKGSQGEWSLKELFELGAGSEGDIILLVYDVRMDSAALYHLFGVRLGGVRSSAGGPPFGNVYDLQVAKCLIAGGRYLVGLSRALGLHLTAADHLATEKGRKVFAPEKGGEYRMWTVRPLPDALVTYCAVTIRYYAILFSEVAVVAFGKSIETVMEITERRVRKQVDQKASKQRDAIRDF